MRAGILVYTTVPVEKFAVATFVPPKPLYWIYREKTKPGNRRVSFSKSKWK